MIDEFMQFKSKEIQTRELHQKQYYDSLQQQIEINAKKEQQLHDQLSFQQNLLFQMINQVSDSSEKALSQKEKNEKLMAQIEEFERKNREMKTHVNNALLLKMGNKTIEDIQPKVGEMDEFENMKLQLRALVANKHPMHLEYPDLIDSPRND